MDTKTGKIYDMLNAKQKAKVGEINAKEPGRVVTMALAPTDRQMSRNPPRIGRNDPCPCGSGKKFKKCHLR